MVGLNGAADLLIVPRSRCHGLAVRQAVHAALEFLWILQISATSSARATMTGASRTQRACASPYAPWLPRRASACCPFQISSTLAATVSGRPGLDWLRRSDLTQDFCIQSKMRRLE